jgi:signal transduction histidine kinase
VRTAAASGWAAALGWGAALGLGACLIEARRRLELVAQAEHELCGPVTALALAVESGANGSGTSLDPELDRLRLGLADLRAARDGRRASGVVEQLPLEGVVGRAVEGWAPAIRRAGGRLALDWRAGPVIVHAERARLVQVIGNLLLNAAEHGGGRVVVSGRRSARGVSVEVRDSGPGFAARRRRAREGRGRGLAIVRKAVKEAGGRLTIESGARGAAVSVALPTVTRPAPAEGLDPAGRSAA